MESSRYNLIQTDILPQGTRLPPRKYFVKQADGSLKVVDKLPSLPRSRVSRGETEERVSFLGELESCFQTEELSAAPICKTRKN
jgi:hypothetical protein